MFSQLVCNAADDEFFLPDDTRYWWHQMPDHQLLNRLQIPCLLNEQCSCPSDSDVPSYCYLSSIDSCVQVSHPSQLRPLD